MFGSPPLGTKAAADASSGTAPTVADALTAHVLAATANTVTVTTSLRLRPFFPLRIHGSLLRVWPHGRR